VHRHVPAQVFHEVEASGADERIEARTAVLANLALELTHTPRREDARHQAAVHRVDRRIFEHHDA
jgi:hypothetical protein